MTRCSDSWYKAQPGLDPAYLRKLWTRRDMFYLHRPTGSRKVRFDVFYLHRPAGFRKVCYSYQPTGFHEVPYGLVGFYSLRPTGFHEVVCGPLQPDGFHGPRY